MFLSNRLIIQIFIYLDEVYEIIGNKVATEHLKAGERLIENDFSETTRGKIGFLR